MWCWRHSFRIVSCESPKTMRKLYLSIKFPHREIRSNYGIFRSDHNRCLIGPKHSSDILLKKWFHHECFPGYFLKFWKKLFMRTAYQKITVLLEWSILFFMNNLCHSEFLELWIYHTDVTELCIFCKLKNFNETFMSVFLLSQICFSKY